MLKTSKSIAISGRSMVDDKQVATFNANIYEANASGGSDNINMIITDRDLYDSNKATVRKEKGTDISASCGQLRRDYIERSQ